MGKKFLGPRANKHFLPRRELRAGSRPQAFSPMAIGSLALLLDHRISLKLTLGRQPGVLLIITSLWR